MATPAILRYGRAVREGDVRVPGRYDAQRGLRVVDTQAGPVPVIDQGPAASLVTKTENAKESDDNTVFFASITKTALGGESHDTDVEATANDHRGVDRSLLALLTKTLHARERDDD